MRKITKITGSEMSRASGTAIKTESKIQFVFWKIIVRLVSHFKDYSRCEIYRITPILVEYKFYGLIKSSLA